MSTLDIIATIWVLLWFWAIFMWYKAFGGFEQKFGLSVAVCLLALVGAPQCAVAWTLAYLMERNSSKK